MKKENWKSKVIIGIVILIVVIGIIGSILVVNNQKKNEDKKQNQGENHRNTVVINGIEIPEAVETAPNAQKEKMTE